eukprot:m.225067 g.225067  ORF g.225067 m.225067 type:complete len:203 (+) comp19198_c0_seq2:296-904(+)
MSTPSSPAVAPKLGNAEPSLSASTTPLGDKKAAEVSTPAAVPAPGKRTPSSNKRRIDPTEISENMATFPPQKVKNIIRDDCHVEAVVGADFVHAVARATELFVRKFVSESLEYMPDEDKELEYEAAAQVVVDEEPFRFLAEVIPVPIDYAAIKNLKPGEEEKYYAIVKKIAEEQEEDEDEEDDNAESATNSNDDASSDHEDD